jgi:predicted Zn-dependent protease
MAVQLEQSPFLSLVSEERIQHTVHLMGQSPNVPLVGGVAREVCERTGSAVVLEGSISSLGERYVLGLRATNCRSGEVLDEEQEQVAKKEDVLDSLSQIAGRFRTRIGESLATVREHNTPLVEATTPSLEALKAYSSGWQVAFSTGSAAALPLFQRATEIDPKFAMGYAMVGRMYGDMGESVLSAENTRKAYELRERANDSERFFISASNDLLVTGNLEKAQQTCELWAQAYPRDARPHGLLAGIIGNQGNYSRAVEESAKSIALDPDFTPGYVNLGYGYLFLDRLGEAAQPIQQASERKLEMPELLILGYQIAFLKGDTNEMARIAALGHGRSGADDWLTGQQAYTAGYSGHLQQARILSRRAAEMAQQEGQRERAAQHLAGAAAREAFAGNAPEARRSTAAALGLSTGRDVQYGVAFALALVDDSVRAQALASDLEARFPEDTLVKFSYMPTLRALFALNRRDPAGAINELQVAIPFEMGWPGSSSVGFIGVLYPVYVRGEAYLAQGRGAEAAVEFQTILAHRGLVVNDLIGALAHLELARALVLSGNKPKARLAYSDFLALWNEADPDLPILRQARAEYFQLK